MSDPYRVPPEIGPAGPPPPGSGYGPQPGGYPGPLPPVPDRSSIQTNSIILIVAGLLCGFMIPSVFGIIALTELDKNPENARRMNKIGWIILIIVGALIVISVLATFVLPLLFGALILFLGAAAGGSSGSGFASLLG